METNNPDQAELRVNEQPKADTPPHPVAPPTDAVARPSPKRVVDAATAAVAAGELVLPGAEFSGAGVSVASLEKMDLTETIPAKQFKLDKAAIEVIRAVKCPGATLTETMYFLYVCSALGLNPLMPGQISLMAYTNKRGERKCQPLIEIGGMRNACLRTTRYRQGEPPALEFQENGKPLAVTISLLEKLDGEWTKRTRRFLFDEFRAFHNKDLWVDMPATMFAKTAEAALLRFYFPDAVSGVYTVEEMNGPDVAGLLSQKPGEEKRTVYEKAKDLLDVAARKYKDLGAEKPKSAAVALARKCVPNHPGTDTWGEAELGAFREAVDKLDQPPAEEKS